jgi:hypothetical protein
MMLAPAEARPAQMRKNSPSRSGVKTLILVAPRSGSSSAMMLGFASPIRASELATWSAFERWMSRGSASQ